jgi:hypothetical protein
MNIVRYYRNKSKRKFFSVLTPNLRYRYGGGKEFTEAQVRTTIVDLKLPARFTSLALAVFCTRASHFDEKLSIEDYKFYQGYRDEIYRSDGGSFGGDCVGSVGDGGAGDGGGD